MEIGSSEDTASNKKRVVNDCSLHMNASEECAWVLSD
jgi:hypothetical protein